MNSSTHSRCVVTITYLSIGLLLLLQNACIPRPGLDERVARAKRKEVVLKEAVLALRMQTRRGLDLADSLYRLATELDPREPRAYDGLGCVATYRGKLIDAEYYFRKAIHYNPRYARAYVHLAFLAARKGENGEARQILEQAIRLDPMSYRARNNYAAILMKRSGNSTERKKAMEELQKAFSLAPQGDERVQRNLSAIADLHQP